jgi:hypothetical protein
VPKDYLANGWEVGLQDYLKEENKKSVRMVA